LRVRCGDAFAAIGKAAREGLTVFEWAIPCFLADGQDVGGIGRVVARECNRFCMALMMSVRSCSGDFVEIVWASDCAAQNVMHIATMSRDEVTRSPNSE
jgi:hypothetical protein